MNESLKNAGRKGDVRKKIILKMNMHESDSMFEKNFFWFGNVVVH